MATHRSLLHEATWWLHKIGPSTPTWDVPDPAAIHCRAYNYSMKMEVHLWKQTLSQAFPKTCSTFPNFLNGGSILETVSGKLHGRPGNIVFSGMGSWGLWVKAGQRFASQCTLCAVENPEIYHVQKLPPYN